jgi:hypothetical protein
MKAKRIKAADIVAKHGFRDGACDDVFGTKEDRLRTFQISPVGQTATVCGNGYGGSVEGAIESGKWFWGEAV